jgi:hypothetical protein
VEDDTETVFIPESEYEPVYIQADVPPKNASGDYLDLYKKQKEQQEEQEAILGVTSMPMESEPYVGFCWKCAGSDHSPNNCMENRDMHWKDDTYDDLPNKKFKMEDNAYEPDKLNSFWDTFGGNDDEALDESESIKQEGKTKRPMSDQEWMKIEYEKWVVNSMVDPDSLQGYFNDNDEILAMMIAHRHRNDSDNNLFGSEVLSCSTFRSGADDDEQRNLKTQKREDSDYEFLEERDDYDEYLVVMEDDANIAEEESNDGEWDYWLVNTGATTTIDTTLKGMGDIDLKSKGEDTVKVGNGKQLAVKMQGGLRMLTKHGSKIMLNNTGVIPGFTKKIISGARLTTKGNKLIIGSNEAHIENPEEIQVPLVHSYDNMWYLQAKSIHVGDQNFNLDGQPTTR